MQQVLGVPQGPRNLWNAGIATLSGRAADTPLTIMLIIDASPIETCYSLATLYTDGDFPRWVLNYELRGAWADKAVYI